MAADLKTAMDKGELKKLLAKTKQDGQPVNCAIMQGDGKTSAPWLLLLDRVKAPKAVEKELSKDFPDAKNPRFGTAVADEQNPKLVKFTLNKALSGAAKGLVKTLKGTGFNKVQLVFEDGSAPESEEDADEQDQAQPAAGGTRPAAPAAPQQQAAPPPPAPPSPPSDAADAAGAPPAPTGQQPSGSGQDAKALTAKLVGLVKRMATQPSISGDGANGAKGGAAKDLATQAQAALKKGDLDSAATDIDKLEKLLGGAAAQAGAGGSAQPGAAGAAPPGAPSGPKQPAAANGADPAVIDKSRLAWVATRKKVESEIDKLHGAISSVYKDHGAAEHLEKAFQTNVEKMLNTLDHSLTEKLDEVNKASAGDRGKLVGEAQQIIQRYQTYLSSEPLIAKMDNNPFVPVAVHRTLSASLTALSKSVR